MKKFLLGVLAGAISTMMICAVLPFALARGRGLDDAPFRRSPSPIIFLRGAFGSRGEFGTIDDIAQQSIMLTTRDGVQKTIIITDETDIYRGPAKIAFSDLSKGQHIMVIASPQADGTLKAKLIRVVSASMFIIHEFPRKG